MAKNDAGDASRDGQVIALLNTIGERLIRSEAEREELERTIARYGRMIGELDDRSGKGEQMFLGLQNQIARAEAAGQSLREGQARFEAQFATQMEKIEKAAQLAERIEEAIAQQARLTRRMEQASQDKIKMIRKLERIEETVMETQDALKSKALVLLTDQNVASKAGVPQLAADAALPAAGKTARNRALGRMSLGHSARLAGVAALVIVAVTAGWAAYQFQSSAMSAAAVPPASARLAANGGKVQANFGAASPHLAETRAGAPAVQETAAAEDGTRDESAAPADTAAGEGAETELASLPQPGEGGGDAESGGDIAAQLNEISPAAGGDALPPVPDSSPVAMPATQARFVPPSASAGKAQPEISVAAFLKSQKETAPLASRIKPDPSLPPVVKSVEKKAFEGVPEAQHDLAAIYTAGQAGVKVDYARAAQWFRESALGGVANARYNLGVLYHQGLGVKQDIGMAISWYAAAAELGHPEAQYNLGIAHIQGVGTDYDPAKAAVYFEKAARSGIMEAAFNLGLIEENGLLGKSAPQKAVYWYKQAADQGSKEARAALDQIVKAQGYTPKDVDRILHDAKPGEGGAPVRKSEAALKALPPVPPLRPEDMVAPGVTLASAAMPAQGAAAPQSRIGAGQTVVSRVQQQLIRLGLYPGTADGVANSMTDDAIRTYQRMNGLEADGRASQALLLHMKTAALGSAIGEGATEQGSRAE